MIKIRPEPLLGASAAEKLIDQLFKILCYHGTVMYDIFRLNEIKTVVKRGRGKLHPCSVRDPVERHQIRGVSVLDCHAESHILHPHPAENLKRMISPPVSLRQSANLIICLLQTFDRYPDAYIWELFAEIHDAVCEETVGGDHDAVAFLIKFPHDILQIRPYKRLAAGDICKIHSGQFSYCLDRYFFFRSGRRLIPVTHRTTRITAVCNNDGSVQLLVFEFLFFHPLSFFLRSCSSPVYRMLMHG